jgi:hypothetical protein
MTAKSGYERLAQVDEYDEDDVSALLHSQNLSKSTHSLRVPSGSHAPGATPAGHKRHRSNSAIDIKAINTRLERCGASYVWS